MCLGLLQMYALISNEANDMEIFHQPKLFSA